MNKTEWERVFDILEKCHSGFNGAYSDYKSGRNKQIRKAAESKVNSSIALARLHVERSPEILGLMSTSRFGHVFAYDEFWQARYFGRDMSEFLRRMKEHIASLPS